MRTFWMTREKFMKAKARTLSNKEYIQRFYPDIQRFRLNVFDILDDVQALTWLMIQTAYKSQKMLI